MRYLSVCSGIEAATCAWHQLGWTPVGFSEIEKFPAAVLAYHYPEVPNFGDMTRYQEWPDDLAPDLLVGGTPCQSFSVAGLRKGLDDQRGNLMLTFGSIARRYRPEWLVWENVPGVLSSNGGRDFGTFLGMLAELGYGFAYRVLDAQYFGVAQRRRRVFVVGHLGDWRRAAAVLFERHSLSGHPAPRREAGEVAPTIPSRSTGGGGIGTDFDCDVGLIRDWPAQVACTLNAAFGSKQGLEDQHALSGASLFVPATVHTLRRLTPRECERLQGFPDVREKVTISLCIGRQKHDVSAALSCRRWQSNVSPADAQEWPQPASVAASNSTMCQAGREPLVVVSVHTSSAGDHLEIRNHGRLIWSANTADVSSASRLPTLNAVIAAELAQAARELALAIRTGKAESLQSIRLSTQVKSGATSARRSGDGREASARGAAAGANLGRFTTFTLGLLGPTSDSKAATSLCSVLAAISGCIPNETLPERFSLLIDLETPYTAIPWRGKPASECPDGPRYKALGNSMAVPVMRWIGERIDVVSAISANQEAP